VRANPVNPATVAGIDNWRSRIHGVAGHEFADLRRRSPGTELTSTLCTECLTHVSKSQMRQSQYWLILYGQIVTCSRTAN